LLRFNLLLLFFSFLFSLTIEDSVLVRRWLERDTYVLGIEVRASAKDEIGALRALGEVDESIRGLSLPYRGGNFVLVEKKRWDPKRREFERVGYEGIVRYTFTLKDPSPQERVFETLSSLKEKLPISYRVLFARYELSERKREELVSELKREAVERILENARRASSIFSKKCEVEKVVFSSPRVPKPPVVMPLSSAKAPKPEREDEAVELSVRYTLVCR